MLDRVPDRLLRDPEEERLGLGLEPEVGIDVEGGLEPARPGRPEHVGERSGEARAMELGGIDVDQQRAELADSVTGLGRRRAKIAVVRSGCVLGRRRERVGDCGQVLDDPVVEILCDPAALDVRRVDGMSEQPLALLLAALDPPREPPRERELDQREQGQRPDHDRSESPEDPSRAGRDEARAVVRLEPERDAARSANRQIDLEQLAHAALETILRLGHVAHLGLDAACPEVRPFLGAERVALSDQSRLVRVEDPAGGIPDLHAHDRVVGAREHALLDDAVDRGERARLLAQEPVGDDRLDGSHGSDPRLVLGVAKRLGVAGAPEEPDTDERDQDDGDQADRRVADHRLPDGTPPALRPTQAPAHPGEGNL